MQYKATLRPLAGEMQYQKDRDEGKTLPLELVPSLRQWTYWRLIENNYPYSIAFKTHHMLIIKRANVGERFVLNDDERKEFEEILRDYVYPNYHLWFENVPSRRTVPHLYHVHLVQYHDNREDMTL